MLARSKQYNMPKYFFTARSRKGESFSGIKEAENKHKLAQILRREGYILTSASLEPEEKKIKIDFLKKIGWPEGVSLKDKIILTRNLQVMISAGVSLPKALKTLSLQSKNKKLKKILREIAEEIIKGKNFSDSLVKYPQIFSELFSNMIKIGEESGTLEENLAILTRHLERENELKSKIKGAMLYPAVIILAMIGIGILMLTMVVPKLAQSFEELNIELPLTTRLVIAFGTFLVEKWYLFILIILVFFFFLRIVLKTREGKKMMDTLFLKIPFISSLVKKTNSAYMVRTLSSLIASGVSLVRCLEIVSHTVGNFHFQEAIIKAKERVKKGDKLSQALKPHQELYPLTVIQMIEVGEETGQTSEILEKLADFFEEEVANTTKNLTAIIEPILMLVIGGAVGFFAISMIQPMYSMLQGIR